MEHNENCLPVKFSVSKYCFGSHIRHKNVFDQHFHSAPNCLCTCQSSMYFGSNTEMKEQEEKETNKIDTQKRCKLLCFFKSRKTPVFQQNKKIAV